MSDVKCECPSCGQHLAIDETASGMRAPCPSCGKDFHIPARPHALPSPNLVRLAVPMQKRQRLLGMISSSPGKYVVWFAIAALVFGGFRSCSAGGGSDRERIMHVLRADRAASLENMGSVSQSAEPAVQAAAVGRYCETMESCDLSQCPADFAVAYRRHVRAWRVMQGAVGSLPNGFWEGFLAGALNNLVTGEMDGGVGRMNHAVQSAWQDVGQTWAEVEEVGARYGAAL